jgi:hypothetical protein
MILRLFVKDLKVGWYFLAPILVLHLLNSPALFRASALHFAANVGFGILVATGVTLIDLRYDNDAAFASLPLARACIVRGRFLTGAFGVLLSLVVHFGSAAVLVSMSEVRVSAPLPPEPMATLIAFLMCTIVPVCLFFPCYYGLGAGRGWIAFGFLLCLAAVIPLMLGETPAGSTLGPDAAPMAHLETRVSTGLIRPGTFLNAAFGQTGSLLATMLGLSGMVMLSLVVSIRLYGRRDL